MSGDFQFKVKANLRVKGSVTAATWDDATRKAAHLIQQVVARLEATDNIDGVDVFDLVITPTMPPYAETP